MSINRSRHRGYRSRRSSSRKTAAESRVPRHGGEEEGYGELKVQDPEQQLRSEGDVIQQLHNRPDKLEEEEVSIAQQADRTENFSPRVAPRLQDAFYNILR